MTMKGPIVRLNGSHDHGNDLRYWLSRPEEERVAAVEVLRQQMIAVMGSAQAPRIEKKVTVRKR